MGVVVGGGGLFFVMRNKTLICQNCTHLFKVNDVWNFLKVNLLTC